jgi:hypothetical protein
MVNAWLRYGFFWATLALFLLGSQLVFAADALPVIG